MWIEIFRINENINISQVSKIITSRGTQYLITNTRKYELNYKIYSMIIYHYVYTKNDPNRLIDIKYINNINNVYINSDIINVYYNTPIFNMICSLYYNITISTYSYNCNNIENRNFLPKPVKNSKFKKSEDFNIKLFDYQKNTINRMIEIENNINTSVDINCTLVFDNIDVKWNPHMECITDTPTLCKITSKGGILSDSMGLGKTITTIGLIHFGNKNKQEDIITTKIFTNATLIIVPSHLSKQWMNEFIKIYNNKKKIIMILTKIQHEKTTYKDIIEADIIIITIQFLSNIKYYYNVRPGISTEYIEGTRSRINTLNDMYTTMIETTDYLKTTQPIFEYFHFNRMIIDEGHEIMERTIGNGRTCDSIYSFITNIETSYKWYISGTPFNTFVGYNNILKYLDVQFNYIDGENIPIEYIDSYRNIDYKYSYISFDNFRDNILSKLMIRHLKTDVEDSINIPGYNEKIEWVELTDAERNIYDSTKNSKGTRKLLQQLCCHPLIAESFKKIVGFNPSSLEEVQDKLIEYHTDNITKYTNKLNKLDKSRTEYKMLLNMYTSKINESNYILSALKKFSETIELNDDNNCIICYDIMTEPLLTPCGHIYCKYCIERCLEIKKECPMCKKEIKHNELITVKKKKVKTTIESTNPLVDKYGSKLGKLIQMIRTLLTQDARIIVFSQWDEMLLLIKKSMIENGIDCSFISGNVYKRTKAIERFKLGGNDNSVILLSLENSASGTNLTEATHIFFIEPIDKPLDIIKTIEGQAIGRAVRLGQKQVVNIIRILCKNTIEEEIYNNLYITV